ncbi:hypothetical protein RclHR1_09020004 [Rhizophagus clarus]|uniref:HCP-like protein n=1 Tax=Rhizophagus clarus TaxID=94130 RepID=A0A2Z6S338_9GLOM|nr:hypothetical protein RclHR1_09020004 [Rhizophagus clarus]
MVAEYNLGKCYENGNGIKKDERKALIYYKKSADQEYFDAQFQQTKAFELFKTAADQGHSYAQFELENCYFNEIGTEVDKIKPFKTYKRATDKRHKIAQINLDFQFGHCCVNDVRSEINREKEFELYNVAYTSYQKEDSNKHVYYEAILGFKKRSLTKSGDYKSAMEHGNITS